MMDYVEGWKVGILALVRREFESPGYVLWPCAWRGMDSNAICYMMRIVKIESKGDIITRCFYLT